jgi:hypothetical protein
MSKKHVQINSIKFTKIKSEKSWELTVILFVVLNLNVLKHKHIYIYIMSYNLTVVTFMMVSLLPSKSKECNQFKKYGEKVLIPTILVR